MHSKEIDDLFDLSKQTLSEGTLTKKPEDLSLSKATAQYMINNDYNRKKYMTGSKPAPGPNQELCISKIQKNEILFEN